MYLTEPAVALCSVYYAKEKLLKYCLGSNLKQLHQINKLFCLLFLCFVSQLADEEKENELQRQKVFGLLTVLCI